jgi:hypothetical protein
MGMQRILALLAHRRLTTRMRANFMPLAYLVSGGASISSPVPGVYDAAILVVDRSYEVSGA